MKRIGYGQVEPNHLSAQRTGQIYAQLPAHSDIEILENGMFAKYDIANGCVNMTGDGEWMLVFNEVKLYDDAWRESYKDFAMKKSNYFGDVMVPRLFKTNVGDIFTTNCIAGEDELEVGHFVVPGADGYLVKGDKGTGMAWKVVKVYTMPDGQPGVKLQRVQ